MSNLPTPRTDAAVADYQPGGRFLNVVPADFARQLERELAEAKAERDALKAIERSYNAQRDLPSDQRTIPDDDAGRAAYWKGRAKSVEGDFAKLSDSLLQEGEAKDRWRALAEELAGALDDASTSLCTISQQAGRTEELRELSQIRGYAFSRYTAAIARFRDAANPASARTPKEEAP